MISHKIFRLCLIGILAVSSAIFLQDSTAKTIETSDVTIVISVTRDNSDYITTVSFNYIRGMSKMVVTPDEGIEWSIVAGPGPYYPTGDMNCDWEINELDMPYFMYHVQGLAGGPLGDFTGDGKANIDDLPGFLDALLGAK